MITCKEDLIGTFIENDNGELRDLYTSICEKMSIDGTPKDLSMNNNDWLGLNRECKFIGVYEGGMWIAHQYRGKEKKLTLEDLKPQTKEVEWVNGDLVCKVNQIIPIGVFVGLDRTGRAVVELNPVTQHANNGNEFMALGLHNIKKPETEAERKEREELELGSALMNAMKGAFPCSVNYCSDDLAKWASVAKDIGYKVKGD